MLLRPTCRQAATLLIAREDQAIRLSDAAALRLHILACNSCRNFEQQLLAMRKAMQSWRAYADGGEAEPDPTPPA